MIKSFIDKHNKHDGLIEVKGAYIKFSENGDFTYVIVPKKSGFNLDFDHRKYIVNDKELESIKTAGYGVKKSNKNNNVQISFGLEEENKIDSFMSAMDKFRKK